MLTVKFGQSYKNYDKGEKAELPEHLAHYLREMGVIKVIEEKQTKEMRASLPKLNRYVTK